LPKGIEGVSALAALVLTFLCLDAVQLCCRFVYALAKDVDRAEAGRGKATPEDPRARPWPGYSAAQLHDADEVSGEPTARSAEPAEHVRCERLHLRVIANCSQEVRWVAMYPFLVFFVLLSVRLPVFDTAGLPWIATTLVVVVVLAVVGGACALRYAASKARQHVLIRLKDGLARATACEDPATREVRVKRYERAIDETEEERRGAFLPLTQDPWFQVLAIPFGGVGGLVLLEHFLGWW
jgi:hypothetical protein